MKVALIFDLLFALLVFYFLVESRNWSVFSSLIAAIATFFLGGIAWGFFQVTKS